ncbi:hypothetical protein GQ607_007884 [Colletotrichum asianum]|uniref:Uncharacterized protein n=1 Tax=Colletotrichum asianum TaxID=702518 RepID=A0A8H3W9U2_9PEZI|nr:hypothetical protein GQ607_007884 [Colletotrichum asianum]
MPGSSRQATRKDGGQISCHQFPDGVVAQYPNIIQYLTSAMSAPLGFPRSLGLVTNAGCYDCQPFQHRIRAVIRASAPGPT